MDNVCRSYPSCADKSDYMPCAPQSFVDPTQPFENFPYPYPIVVEFAETRVKNYKQLSDDQCPDTHFRCPGSRICLPVFVRCNDQIDCPGHVNEAGRGSYTCAGHYRCRGSMICVHPTYLCDATAYHCPHRDDELCRLDCTDNYTCYGTVIFCRDVFPAGDFPELSFLDGSDSGLTPADLVNDTLLVHLSLARCGLTNLPNMTFGNLQHLDISENSRSEIRREHLIDRMNLRTLILASSRVTRLFCRQFI